MAQLDRKAQVANKAYTLYNAALNQGLHFTDAKAEAVKEAQRLREEFDKGFEVDPADPLKSEAVWDAMMNKYKELITYIESI